jgi:hypothetical protein
MQDGTNKKYEILLQGTKQPYAYTMLVGEAKSIANALAELGLMASSMVSGRVKAAVKR